MYITTDELYDIADIIETEISITPKWQMLKRLKLKERLYALMAAATVAEKRLEEMTKSGCDCGQPHNDPTNWRLN